MGDLRQLTSDLLRPTSIMLQMLKWNLTCGTQQPSGTHAWAYDTFNGELGKTSGIVGTFFLFYFFIQAYVTEVDYHQNYGRS